MKHDLPVVWTTVIRAAVHQWINFQSNLICFRFNTTKFLFSK